MSTSSAASTAGNPSPPRRTARRRGRPVSILGPGLVAALLCASAAPAADDACGFAAAEPIRLRHVHDGDTVVRADGERIRLIGLDTPELARDGRPAEPGAVAAREHLQRLIDRAETLGARYGAERRDDYDRLLAHLYADGRNLQAALLAEGLATPLFIPPNLAHDTCYARAAARARQARRGLWGLPQYRPRPAGEIILYQRGYRVVTGTVERVGRSRCCVWLNLTPSFALRIEHRHRPLFTSIGDFDELAGTPVMARGMVYRRNGELRLQLRHPADLTVFTLDSAHSKGRRFSQY